MTDKEIIEEEDQDVELYDEVTDEVDEVVEMAMDDKKKKPVNAAHMKKEMAMNGKKKKPMNDAHDPKNAEAQSVDSVDKAGDATGTAPKRKGDQGTQDPMPKTKAGMINAMMMNAQKANKVQVQAMYKEMMKKEMAMKKEMMKKEGVDMDDQEVISDINYQADFSEDLNALVNEEATLSDDFKAKAETIFEAAIKSKLTEEIDRLEAKYEEELAEEIKTTKEDLVEKVDSYLNYVVEQWMEDNKVEVQTGLRTEIAEKFMNNLKDLFTESYIEVPESKVDLVDGLAAEVEELEEKLNDTTGKAIEMAEELEAYKREAIIREASKDLAETQVEKLKTLVADVDFESEETFAEKVGTVKESYFTKAAKSTDEEIVNEEDAFTAEASDSMSQYLNAIKRTSK